MVWARRASIACLVAVALLGCASAPAAPPAVSPAAPPDGIALVERGQYAAALPLLEGQLAAAREAGDDPRASNLLFYLGLCEQKLAQESSGEARQAALQRAASHYEAMLELRESGSGLNNLAQVYTELGQDQRASRLYQEAIAQNDGRKSFYARRYAEFLEERGHPEAAISWAEIAVGAYPDDAAANRTLMGLYLQKDRPAALRHALEQYRAGRFEQAQSLALQAVSSGGWAAKDLALLRTLVAGTLLYSSYDRPAFRSSEVGQALWSSGDSELRGIVELHQDRRGRGHDPYGWWLLQRERVAGGLSPRETFLALVVSLGDWHKSLGERHESLAGEYESRSEPDDMAEEEREKASAELDVAEAYYLHGLDLSGRWIDASAFVALVRLYFEQKRMEEIEALNLRYSRRLYGGKGDAYARGDWEGIYRFHMALGMMYAHLKIWQSDSRYANAIFQLEHARKAASNYNRNPRKGGPSRLGVPPQALNLLAEGYEAVGPPERADELRLTAAGEFLELDDTWAAGLVIAGIAPETLTASQSERYRRIRASIPGP